MKEKNFTDLYVEYCKEQTDAPGIFHRFLSYLVVSSVVNRNVSIPFGYKIMHPNLFILLAAPSSAHRKSWSQNIACHMINRIHENFIIPDMSSREAFIAELSDQNRSPAGSGLIKIDELKGFIDRAKNNQHYEGFIQDLSSLYDGEKLRRRKGVSNPEFFTVEDPFLNMTCACSLDWLYKSIEQSDVSGGFLARFIWVVYDQKVENPSALPKRPDQNKFGELMRKLDRMSEFIGEITFDGETLNYYERWYKDFYYRHQGGMWDANYHRLAVIIQKISALNALIRNETYDISLSGLGPAGIKISIGDLKMAIMMLEDTTINFKGMTIGSDRIDSINKRILKFIASNNQTNRKMILQGVRGVNSVILDKSLRTLMEAEVIEMKSIKNELTGHVFPYFNTSGNFEKYLEM